jgi:uncharacterized protein YrzB (UPF0473 family)
MEKELKENENRLTFVDEKGNEILCEILFTFESEEFKKSYVLFYPVGSKEEQLEVMAASYVSGENGEGELAAVETDEEWDMIEKVLKQYEEDNDQDEECECDDDDCECECDGDCECDDEKCTCEDDKCTCEDDKCSCKDEK